MAKTSKTAILPPVLLPDALALTAWYRQNRRDLPWRSHQGRAPSPYHTWLSEIMLQQTGVITVIPYYQRFTARWPNVESLAAASEDDVLQEWAGLGYYSRARNLLKCAKAVTEHHNGQFPSDLKSLKSLPGIGDYTANAIRAIAFDLPANVVDGNVERVISRIFAYDEPVNLPAGKNRIRELAASIAPESDTGDYAQGLMELGALICKPRKPDCPECPWQKNCAAYASGQTGIIPVIQRRPKLPERQAAVFVLQDKNRRYFLRQRPSSGLLGGLWEFPSSPWGTRQDNPPSEIRDFAPVNFEGLKLLDERVVHVFTHFKLTMAIYIFPEPVDAINIKQPGAWFGVQELPALPTLMKKVMATARKGLGD